MGLPLGAPQFESFLQSLRPDNPAAHEDLRELTVIPEERVYVDDERLSILPPVTIWYSEKAELSPTALLRKISEELRACGHPGSPELAQIVLGFFTYAERSSGLSVSQFNEVFSQIASADLNQYFLFSLRSPPLYRFKVGAFSIGPFSPDRLAYQSRKAVSDYYERYEALLRQSPLAIERDPFPVRIVPWHKLTYLDCAWSWDFSTPDEIRSRLWDSYFSELSASYFKGFFESLNEAQEIAMALGSGWFDATPLAQLTRTHRVSVYMNIAGENKGFVSPAEAGVFSINLGGAHLGIPATQNIIKEHFGISALTDSEIHQLIRTFSRFLALSVKHTRNDRPAEGFLHSVIALDLVLGEKMESTKTIVNRSAVLSHKPLRKPFAQAVRDCEIIYDARSKYVHAGKIPEKSLFDPAMRICREIAFCLFRLQRRTDAQQAGFRDKWVKEIDFIAAVCEAGRTPSVEDLARIGVGLEGEYGFENFQQDLKAPIAPNTSQ
jgi:hypothetical protein